MSFLERIKGIYRTIDSPTFGMICGHKLYLPNVGSEHTILGKWSLEWTRSEQCFVGNLISDVHQNLIFHITDAHRGAQQINRSELSTYLSRVYKYDPFLSLFQLKVSDSPTGTNLSSPSLFETKRTLIGVKDKPKPIQIQEINVPSKVSTPAQTMAVQPKVSTPVQTIPVQPKIIIPVEVPQVKEKVIDIPSPTSSFHVCKTDKPDVYHVYQHKKYLSTCLIPNMKTSRYMQTVFEDKSLNEMVSMNMKLHTNTNRYYPVI
jgi:hypothetical protein